MKHITEYQPTGEQVKKELAPVNEEMKQVLNELWLEIKGNRPSFASQLKTTEDIKRYMLSFEKAFKVNGIDSMEKLKSGLKRFYQSDNAFIPTPAQFAIWCKEEYSNDLHFKQLEENTKRIMDERRRLPSKTFEERQHEARANLMCCREIIKKNCGGAA